MKNADGHFVSDRLLGYFVIVRTADWNYANDTATRQPRSGAIQADSLACHKPLEKQSYSFGFEALAKAH